MNVENERSFVSVYNLVVVSISRFRSLKSLSYHV